MSKKINIALYGFGRIGRNLFRLGYDNPNYNFVAISDFGSAETLQYLLSRDSIHGAMEEPVELDGNYLKVKDQHVRVISGGEPGTIPWDALQAEIVIDATGRFLTREKLALHLESGAKRVFLTRNPKDDIDRYVIPGINESSISANDKIISTTSSTTQVLALMVKMLDDVECSPFLLVTIFPQRIKARAYPIFRKCTVEYCPKTPRLPLFVRCLVPLVERDRVATTKHFLDSFFVVFSSLFDSLCQRFCQVDSRSPLNYPRRSEFRCKHSGHARPPEPSAGRAGTMDGPVQRRSRWYADKKCLVWISRVYDPFALENAKSAVFAADTHFPFSGNPFVDLLPAHELGRYLFQ